MKKLMRELKMQADLHAHSGFFNPACNSRITQPFKISLEGIVRAGKEKFLDIIPISSHHDNRWDFYFGKSSQYEGVEGAYVINTREIQSLHNGKRIDVNVVCPIDDADIRKIAPKSKSLDYVLSASKNSGGIVILAHNSDIKLIRRLLEEGKIDSFEQHNWLEGSEVKVPGHKGVAVSDAHYLRDYGRARTYIDMLFFSPENLRQALEEGSFELFYPSGLSNNIHRRLSQFQYALNITEAVARTKLGLPT